MSKSTKAALITAVCCIAVGLIIIWAVIVRIGFDFTKLNTMQSETKTYDVQEVFQNIDIRGLDCDISLVPAADGQCRVVSNESDKIVHTVRVENNTLAVTRTDTRRWYERIGIWWGIDPSVTVYLPEKAYQALYLETVSGSIRVPENFQFSTAELLSTSGDISFSSPVDGGLSVKTTSGDIRTANTSGGDVKVTTTSGEVSLSQMRAAELQVTATSGDISLSGTQAAGLQVKTTSGDIEASALTVDGKAELVSVSGEIEMEDADAGAFYIKTVSGDVEGSIRSSKNFITHTTSGEVLVPPSDSTAGNCEITTTSGDIRVSIRVKPD